jgi:ABC-type uncharacterized transport system substrate-binding protein
MWPARRSPAMLMVILALGLLAAPPPAGAQSAGKIARIGVLGLGVPPSEADLQRSPFRQALRELGWVEGNNITIEARFADGDLERLPALAAELVRLQVDLIVTSGGIVIRAAQHATSTIPIVMAGTGDPVQAGFVASLAAPGGNITGVSNRRSDLNAKRLELLKEAVPGASRVAVLADPATPYTPGMVHETEQAAQAFGVQALRRPSPRSPPREWTRSWCCLPRGLMHTVAKSSTWWPIGNCRRFMMREGLFRLAVSCRIQKTAPSAYSAWPRTWTRSSKAPSPLTCPSSSP